MEELLEGLCCPAAHFSMPGFLIVPKFPLRLIVERGKQIERDISRLKMGRIGLRNVMAEAAQRCLARKDLRLTATKQRGGISTSEQAGCNGFCVTFNARDLPGKKDARIAPQLQRGGQQGGGGDVGVAVHLAEAQKLGALEARYQAEDARLIAKAHIILESDQVVAIGALVLLPELHRSIGPAAGARIG